MKEGNGMGMAKKRCGWCGGTGEAGSQLLPEKCDVCKGFKKVLMDSRTEPCPDCGGTGKVGRDTVYGPRPCRTCGRTGWALPPKG